MRNIHAAFAEPGRILTQVIKLPDGTQWFSIARTVRRALAPYGAIEPRYAIGLDGKSLVSPVIVAKRGIGQH